MSPHPERLDLESAERRGMAGTDVKKSSRWLRYSETVLVGYFAYTTILAGLWRLPSLLCLCFGVIPVALLALAYFESTRGGRATGVFREWIPAALALPAYWEVSWFWRPQSYALENQWVAWDRLLLNHWHVRAAIESWGPVIPSALEFCYLLIYAIPPLSLGILYWCHRRRRVDRFLFTFFLGTLLTYALLPYFPSEPPRIAFRGADLPGVNTFFRQINVWLLDHCDIHTSVFPSGHVTAAFSAAFGMLLALPEKKRVGAALLILAIAIAITTVYGRYHYAVDAIAGLSVSLAATSASITIFSARE
ncbi:MAG: hypothetical protein DMG59_20790 [Acidobacteria bacterium]|nr:MAG: hypothetical protein DMG59_20790 [Acidobacteriota bacterium]